LAIEGTPISQGGVQSGVHSKKMLIQSLPSQTEFQ